MYTKLYVQLILLYTELFQNEMYLYGGDVIMKCNDGEMKQGSEFIQYTFSNTDKCKIQCSIGCIGVLKEIMSPRTSILT